MTRASQVPIMVLGEYRPDHNDCSGSETADSRAERVALLNFSMGGSGLFDTFDPNEGLILSDDPETHRIVFGDDPVLRNTITACKQRSNTG